MIVSVGIDIVEVSRIRDALSNPRFASRILTQRELAAGSTVAYIAGRWAVKEAVAKAVGTGLRWHDVEVINDPDGKPRATIRRGLPDGHRLHVSISHEKGHAVGLAVLEGGAA